jgi:hypothetical protein
MTTMPAYSKAAAFSRLARPAAGARAANAADGVGRRRRASTSGLLAGMRALLYFETVVQALSICPSLGPRGTCTCMPGGSGTPRGQRERSLKRLAGPSCGHHAPIRSRLRARAVAVHVCAISGQAKVEARGLWLFPRRGAHGGKQSAWRFGHGCGNIAGLISYLASVPILLASMV